MEKGASSFPVWALVGFILGAVFGGGVGYVLALETEKNDHVLNLVLAGFMSGGGAAGGAVIGGVRDLLAYLDRRFPPLSGPSGDYRDNALPRL